MNTNEFKAFIQGLEYAFVDGAPTKEQWDLIKEKINELGSQKVTRGASDGVELDEPYVSPHKDIFDKIRDWPNPYQPYQPFDIRWNTAGGYVPDPNVSTIMNKYKAANSE